MIVVDNNVIAYLFVQGEQTTRAEAALAKDRRWMAPLLWRSEFRNVLVRLSRQGILSPAEALRTMERAEERMAGQEYAVSSRDVIVLAAASGCSAYDCEYVALAQDHRVRLVTTDQQVLREFPAIAIPLDEFVA